jgi:hypothetical protein
MYTKLSKEDKSILTQDRYYSSILQTDEQGNLTKDS